jgi:hypothetical protein
MQGKGAASPFAIPLSAVLSWLLALCFCLRLSYLDSRALASQRFRFSAPRLLLLACPLP